MARLVDTPELGKHLPSDSSVLIFASTVASSDDSSSSEDEGEMSEARRRRKEKMKEKIEKKARKLMKKRIKEEKEKHPFYGMHQVPHNYEQQGYSSSQFQSIHLGHAPYFDGTDYPKWAFDMKMHLYGLHPLVWEIVCVGVTPPAKDMPPTAEQAQEFFRNAQAIRVITGSLCIQEFNKVRNVEIAKKYLGYFEGNS